MMMWFLNLKKGGELQKIFIFTLFAFLLVINVSANNVVINEFLADNDTTQADPHGEYDDWIELYNNTDSIINLTNYYLTDDSTDLTQWVFPDTFIDANNYLIIWADDDSGQIGLHANFKLSKSGEEIYLLDNNQTIIDEIVFGQQSQDISSGRYPNGTGSFIEMIPSFESVNTGPVGIEEIISNEEALLYQNYPNPFTNTTMIRYYVPITTYVNICIYNTLGQKIKNIVNTQQNPGIYSVQWDRKDFSSNEVGAGMFLLTIETENNSETRKMIVIE